MNRARLRTILKRFHPDHNGGRNEYLQIVRNAITLYQRDRKERKCACGNGKSRVSKRCFMCNLKVRNRKRLMLAAAAMLAAMFSLAVVLPPGTLRTSVTLAWNYPTNQLSTNLTFKIYSSTNLTLPVTNWPLVQTVAGTNLSVTMPIDGQQRWYVMTSSNWWGESSFSNVAGTEPLPRSDVDLGIGP